MFQLEDVVHQRRDDEAIVRWNGDKFRFGQAFAPDGDQDVFFPDGLQCLFLVVGVDVDDLDLLGKKETETHRLFGDAVPTGHGNDDDGLLEVDEIEGRSVLHLALDAGVVAFDGQHDADEERHEKSRDPGASDELRYEHNDEGNAGCDGASAVDEHVPETAGVLLHLLPVNYHACLREGEGEEGADGVEGDQAVGNAAEEDEDDGGEAGEGVDAVGEEEAAAAKDEDVRKVIVEGNGLGEAGEVGEGGIGAEGESYQDRGRGEVVEPSSAEDCRCKDTQDALEVRLIRLHCGNAVGTRKVRDAEEEDDENGDDNGEGALSLLGAGLAKGHDAVRYGFNAGHGSAATGECL